MNPWWLLLIAPVCFGAGFWVGINTIGKGIAEMLYTRDGLCRECNQPTHEHVRGCLIGRYGL
jgi:hypothetical protein